MRTNIIPLAPAAAAEGETGRSISLIAGNQLLYSTFIPGVPPVGIALDPKGNVYLASVADPRNSPFPVTPGAFQAFTSTSSTTGLVAKLNGAGTALVYATYLGGSGGDEAVSIAVDPSGTFGAAVTDQGTYRFQITAPVAALMAITMPRNEQQG